MDDIPLIKAWQLYLGLPQKEVAEKAGITQGALSQFSPGALFTQNATSGKMGKQQFFERFCGPANDAKVRLS
ncbi:MAG: helix-turn-helix transcriptional regulator [Desulfotignum sp.]|nr:helix-turn-helix transcriptional regulator [Desulfotignum sp.]